MANRQLHYNYTTYVWSFHVRYIIITSLAKPMHTQHCQYEINLQSLLKKVMFITVIPIVNFARIAILKISPIIARTVLT